MAAIFAFHTGRSVVEIAVIEIFELMSSEDFGKL